MSEWTPKLDEVDLAILERLAALGKVPLYLRDVCDAPKTRPLAIDEVRARVEILIAAGFIRRTDHFEITAVGTEMFAGESGASEPSVTDAEPADLPHESVPLPRREPRSVRSRSMLSSTRRLA